jgi:alpha-D-ribose 1-methylphosphonate 5-triphosphate synthase subunit PhnH
MKQPLAVPAPRAHDAAHSMDRGFADPVRDAQATFRAVMMAFAEPGTVREIVQPADTCAGFSAAMTAIALTLADFETRVWLEPDAPAPAAQYVRFHTGAAIVGEPAQAAFAFLTRAQHLPRLGTFAQGSLEYPDTSTTLVIDVGHIETGRGYQLTGPGILGTRSLSVGPLPETFAADITANRAAFPCGVDLIFSHGTRIAALPRSTRVEKG